MGAKYSLGRTLFMVENLSVVYHTKKGPKTIIKDVNMTEKDALRPGVITGQRIALVGISGCGKSTFLRAFTGLAKPTEGRILVADLSPQAKEGSANIVQAGEMGFVDQKYTLFRHRTVNSALMYALRRSGLSEKEKIEKVESSLQTWGLTGVKDQYPESLSGGQRQRTAILEQILCSQHFMVLDEPFSGQDVINIRESKKSFDVLADHDEFSTILFTTHQLEIAVEISDSIYIMGYPTVNGEKQTYGTMIKHYDLKEMGLAWGEFGAMHRELVKDIEDFMWENSNKAV